MDTHDLVRALGCVPQFRPAIIQLAWELVREDGTVDDKKVAFYGKELEEALKEAESYARATADAIRCLRTLL